MPHSIGGDLVSVTPRTRRQVIARDESICQWCGLYVDTTTGDYSLQHRRARGMGGSRLADTDLPSNLVLVHGSGTTGCHGYIESHREEAIARGFNVAQINRRRPILPADVPLLAHAGPAGRWYRFDDAGGREVVHPGDADEYMRLIGATRERETA